MKAICDSPRNGRKESSALDDNLVTLASSADRTTPSSGEVHGERIHARLLPLVCAHQRSGLLVSKTVIRASTDLLPWKWLRPQGPPNRAAPARYIRARASAEVQESGRKGKRHASLLSSWAEAMKLVAEMGERIARVHLGGETFSALEGGHGHKNSSGVSCC